MRKDPEEFVLWLNGAVDVSAGTVPTPEQWAVTREHLTACVGGIIKNRMLRARYEEEWENIYKRQQIPATPIPAYQPAWPTYSSTTGDSIPPPVSLGKSAQ